MVSTAGSLASNHRRFIIQANQSMSWKQTLLFLYAAYAVTGAIVIGCLYAGMWLVLPFSGLEMLLLTSCLYIVSCRTSVQEVITVDDNQIVIEVGRRHVQNRKIFSRYWAKVTLKIPPHRWYASRLIIGSHGNRVEVGRYLGEEERIDLANALAQLIHGHQRVSVCK